MIFEISKLEIARLVNHQLTNIFLNCDDVTPYLEHTFHRIDKCFSLTRNKYYHDEHGNAFFNPFHSGQYSIFLYYLSNTIHYEGKNETLATKVYYLNKVLNSVDWYYEIKLPEFFGVEHPLSSVLGRAEYGNGLFIYQGCTVGGNKGKYPTIGSNVILYSNSTVIGNTVIGDNVAISTGTIIKDEIIPSNCLVFGQSPNLIIKEKNQDYMNKLISGFWLS